MAEYLGPERSLDGLFTQETSTNGKWLRPAGTNLPNPYPTIGTTTVKQDIVAPAQGPMPNVIPSMFMQPNMLHTPVVNGNLQAPLLPAMPAFIAPYPMVNGGGLPNSPFGPIPPPPPPILPHPAPKTSKSLAASPHARKRKTHNWSDRRSSRYIGVGWVVKDQKWEAKIRLNGKKTYLGY